MKTKIKAKVQLISKAQLIARLEKEQLPYVVFTITHEDTGGDDITFVYTKTKSERKPCMYVCIR